MKSIKAKILRHQLLGVHIILGVHGKPLDQRLHPTPLHVPCMPLRCSWAWGWVCGEQGAAMGLEWDSPSCPIVLVAPWTLL